MMGAITKEKHTEREVQARKDLLSVFPEVSKVRIAA